MDRQLRIPGIDSPFVIFISVCPVCLVAMFDSIPNDVPVKHLSGAAAFVRSNGEADVDMDKGELIYVLNEYYGLARVADDEASGRANVAVTRKDSDEYDEADYLPPEEYAGNVFFDELQAWASDTAEAYDGE